MSFKTKLIIWTTLIISLVTISVPFGNRGTQLDASGCNNQPTPTFQSSFEDITKLDEEYTTLSIPHYFEFGHRNHNNPGAYFDVVNDRAVDGNKSVYLNVNDISKSRRAEFNLMQLDRLAEDEVTVSVWHYWPSDYGLHAPGIDWNWHEFFVIYSEYETLGQDHYLRLINTHPDITVPEFFIDLGGRRPPNGNSYQEGEKKPFDLPRGRWFNITSYLKRGSNNNGEVKVWVDGDLVFEESGFTTQIADGYKSTIGKLYYHTGDTTEHEMWIDDLKIWDSYVEPISEDCGSSSSSSSTTTSTTPSCPGDLNEDNEIDLADLNIFASNYKVNNIVCGYDIVGDNCYLDINDFSAFATVYGSTCN